MKRFIKICLILAASCLVISIGCLVGGFALGGSLGEVVRAFERGDFTIGSASKTEALEYEDEVYDGYDVDFDDADDFDDDIVEIETSLKEGALESFQYGAEDIEKIEVDMRGGYLYLIPHEKKYIQIEVEEDGGEKSQVQSRKKEVKITNNLRNHKGGVAIFYPEDMEFREVDISMRGGEVLVEGPLHAGEMDVEMGAGIFEGGVIYTTKASWEVGAGEAIIDELSGDEIDLECGTGTLQAAVKGKQSDYNYELECGVGTLLLGEDEYSGVALERTIDNGQTRTIEASCGIGTLELQFH